MNRVWGKSFSMEINCMSLSAWLGDLEDRKWSAAVVLLSGNGSRVISRDLVS